jgi:hypothetical protein
VPSSVPYSGHIFSIDYLGTDVPNWPPFCFIDNDRTINMPSDFLPGRLVSHHLASKPGPALPDWSPEKILPSLA